MSKDDPTPAPGDPSPSLQLDYPAPHLSTLDRLIEPIVRAARTVRIAGCFASVVMAIVGAAFAAWAIHRLARVFGLVGG